ncbi:hypothetical protein [Paraburkholderia silvatlantica]|uniref:hypothetical protein n=1 Tax=Paraburkholderia silvatlantica TaxID=321895 RepID=UPI003751D7E9
MAANADIGSIRCRNGSDHCWDKAHGYSCFDVEQNNFYEEFGGGAVRPYFKGVSMDIVRLENATGIASLSS